jgi:hypothetical protein
LVSFLPWYPSFLDILSFFLSSFLDILPSFLPPLPPPPPYSVRWRRSCPTLCSWP